MKRIYLLLSFAFLASTAMAQIDVTFAVDMTGVTVSDSGLHVTGNWQEAAGGSNWTPGTSEMTDAGGGLYTLTVNIPAGGYEFKYINGNDWPDEESIPAVSQVGFGNGNRYFQLTAAGNGLDTIPFSGSAMPGFSAVKVMVDMADQEVDSTGAHVAGDMFTPNWTPNATPLYNVSNAIYAAVVQVANGDYQYKFLRSNDWGTDESVPDDCGAGGNRTITVAGDMEDGPNCFAGCGPCAVPTDITFKVDMNQSCMDFATDGVNLMGTATDWGDGAAMDDSDGDGVFELTLGLQPGDYEYKFKTGETWEGVGNRPLAVVDGEAQVLDPICFNSNEVCPAEFFDPADLTFNVDVNAEDVPDGQFVWVMGDFTGWQGGAIKMTDDDNDGIWSTTVADFCPQTAAFKFAIGTDPPEGDAWVEESGDFSEIGGCGTDNDPNTDNRFFQRSSDDAEMLCYEFNTCDACLVGIEEIESLNRVEVYPNPVVGDINIVFENSDNYMIRLLDVTGKVIFSTEVNAAKTTISSDNLNSGIYFIQITDTDNNTVTRKIVK
ncbi:MAG: hypothetical protein DRI54_06935 [Bacteroidetes bacterium]|nr:MAG: hypothetical protein DRI54_06935 [Bacteroidota bacterium]